jgi:multidrug efflux system outer membrane protein
MRGYPPVTRCLAAVIVCLAAILPGCAVGPDYRAPTPELPERWHEAGANGIGQRNANVAEWWQVFEDETLSSLMERAAEGNLDLRIAVLRIREARALRGIAAGELLPSLSGQSAWQRARASANGLLGGVPQAPGKGTQFATTVTRGIAGSALAENLGTAIPGAPAVTNSVANGLMGLLPSPTRLGDTEAMDLYAAGFDASWEIDVFGGIRRNVESADAALAATVEDYRGVLVSLLAEVAATYIDIRSLQSQIEATQRNIKLQQETLSLTQVKFDTELVSELDVRQAETNLATTESELPLFEAGLSVAIYRMGVLIGREPVALYDELSVVH